MTIHAELTVPATGVPPSPDDNEVSLRELTQSISTHYDKLLEHCRSIPPKLREAAKTDPVVLPWALAIRRVIGILLDHDRRTQLFFRYVTALEGQDSIPWRDAYRRLRMRMALDHSELDVELDWLRTATADYRGAGRSPAVCDLIDSLRALHNDARYHVRLEYDQLFPRVVRREQGLSTSPMECEPW